MTLRKVISNEFRLVSLTLLDKDDSDWHAYRESLKIVREAHEKLGIGEDPLSILIRLEELDSL